MLFLVLITFYIITTIAYFNTVKVYYCYCVLLVSMSPLFVYLGHICYYEKLTNFKYTAV